MGKNFNRILKEFKVKLDTISQDPKTGAIESKVTYLPDFEKVYWGLEEVRDDLYTVIFGTRGGDLRKRIETDNELKNMYDMTQKLFNRFRTHLRKHYPNEYSDIKNKDLSENFETGVGEQYATPKAFKNTKKLKEEENSVKVIWVDRNYKQQEKVFKNDPNGPPENALSKAKKFKDKLEKEDKKSKYGLYRNITIQP